MPGGRYEIIRSFLHVNNNSRMLDKSDRNHDKLFKIRLLITMFNQQFSKVPFRHHLDIDEKICKSKATNFLRQYLPNKPHPWGTKLFLLCDDLGYCYQFEVYCGGENHTLQPGEVDLKATGNTVVRLMRLVPSFMNHKLNIDNYYTSIPLMIYLRAHGILTCGTMRCKCIPNCKLPTDLKKRGEMVKHVAKDTMVTMGSTFVGSKPSKLRNSDEIAEPQLIDRWNKKKKRVETIPSPQAVVEYNRYMGYMAMVNAWTLYKRATKKGVKLHESISEVAEVLCRAGNIEHRRGRPPKDDPGPPPNVESKKRNVFKPPPDMRFDEIDHLTMAKEDTKRNTFFLRR
ncbi:piggyBac transposable element-derived protein 4-like [Sitodiplosis mosellana]|uniref:piggyBac transposable element-derived protein 4-like n=1 Tax=Sitodiplosis mosellana TaxID=263140 RepID=UPI002444CDDC|nr:piggyBac transposable element-derived protein 4-like [Sitodiplosis mosellana]